MCWVSVAHLLESELDIHSGSLTTHLGVIVFVWSIAMGHVCVYADLPEVQGISVKWCEETTRESQSSELRWGAHGVPENGSERCLEMPQSGWFPAEPGFLRQNIQIQWFMAIFRGIPQSCRPTFHWNIVAGWHDPGFAVIFFMRKLKRLALKWWAEWGKLWQTTGSLGVPSGIGVVEFLVDITHWGSTKRGAGQVPPLGSFGTLARLQVMLMHPSWSFHFEGNKQQWQFPGEKSYWELHLQVPPRSEVTSLFFGGFFIQYILLLTAHGMMPHDLWIFMVDIGRHDRSNISGAPQVWPVPRLPCWEPHWQQPLRSIQQIQGFRWCHGLIEDILLKHPFPLVNTTYTSLEILQIVLDLFDLFLPGSVSGIDRHRKGCTFPKSQLAILVNANSLAGHHFSH